MKKALVIISFFIVLTCSACSLFDNDLAEFLEYYTSNAEIVYHSLDGNYPVFNGYTHIPSEGNRIITFSINNPQEFGLKFSVEWKNQILIDTPPVEGMEYYLYQTDKNTIKLELTKDFLEFVELNDRQGNISGKILVSSSDMTRVFNPYEFDLVVNTLPPVLDKINIVSNENIATWILAFDLLSEYQRLTTHNDICTIRIDDTDYPLTINADASFTVGGGLTVVPPSNSSGVLPLVNELKQPYTHTANTVYLITDIPTSQNVELDVVLIDCKNAASDIMTVQNSGVIRTQYYVSEFGDDGFVGSSGSPLKTIEKAVEHIVAGNDTSLSYTINLLGSIPNTTLNLAQASTYSIDIQGSGTNTVQTLEIGGEGLEIRLGTTLKVNELVVLENAQIKLDGANVELIDFRSTNVSIESSARSTTPVLIRISTTVLVDAKIIENSGANFGISDFELVPASLGSLYLSSGHLYYSSTKEYTPEGLFTLDTGTSEIISYAGTELNVVIPPEINGVEVRSIAKNAFSSKSIVSIEIPYGVTIIEESAFSDCVDLKTIIIPTSVKTIEAIAFVGCASLETVVTDWTKKSNGASGGSNPYPEYDAVTGAGWNDSFNTEFFNADWVALTP